MALSYSMQDWFLRVGFAPSCGINEKDEPIAEMPYNANGDFDVVINSKWLANASADDLRAVLHHQFAHAVECFIQSRKKA